MFHEESILAFKKSEDIETDRIVLHSLFHYVSILLNIKLKLITRWLNYTRGLIYVRFWQEHSEWNDIKWDWWELQLKYCKFH